MPKSSARKGKVRFLGVAILLAGAAQAAASQYIDIPAGSWYADAVTRLTADGIVSGYDAGSGLRRFEPARQVTRAEFLKMCLERLLDDGLRQSLSLYGLLKASPFPDVPADQWPAPYTAFAKTWNIVDPHASSFSPNSSITRTDAVAMIFRTMELSGSLVEFRGDRIFTDVGPQDVHIHKVYMAGIVDGYSDGSFRPTALLTRAEAVVQLDRAKRSTSNNFGLLLSAQTPITPHFPARQSSQTRDSVGIRLNNPASSDNLVLVHLGARPVVLDAGVEYYLRRSGPGIRVWRLKERIPPAWIDESDEHRLDDAELRAGVDVFVESTARGSVYLSLEARNHFDGRVLSSVSIRLNTFSSLVIILGGEGQHPGDYDPADGSRCSSCGLFDLGYFLYSDGYDAQIFDEDDVDFDGFGRVFDAIRVAVDNRGISTIAVIGYSHGGGSTLLLSRRLRDDQTIKSPYSLSLSAYVDAIRSGTVDAETARPFGSQYHLNIYETFTLVLHGSQTFDAGLPTKNIPVTDEWGSDLNHFTIDDDSAVAREVVKAVHEHVDP